jgi:hypothetical protein
MHFAKDNGIEIDQLNTHMKVSGSGILHRVRRSKKRTLKSRVSIQIPRFGKDAVVFGKMHEYLPTIEKSLARRQLLINQRLSRACIVHLVINKTNWSA